MAELIKDITGKTPNLYDVICFNPPRWKGVVLGLIINFSKAGYPIYLLLEDLEGYGGTVKEKIEKYLETIYGGEVTQSVKTGFVIVDNYQFQ